MNENELGYLMEKSGIDLDRPDRLGRAAYDGYAKARVLENAGDGVKHFDWADLPKHKRVRFICAAAAVAQAIRDEQEAKR